MAEVKFYRCNHCGNIIAVVRDGGVDPVCCGETMQLLEAGSTDAAVEKHVPVVSRDGDDVVVRVGSVDHPMLEEHYIQWIAVACDGCLSIRRLTPGSEPQARFAVGAGVPVSVYEYCNLHGLWRAEA